MITSEPRGCRSEGGAGDGIDHPQRPRGAPHQGRLAGAQLAAHEHHVTRLQINRELGAHRLGLSGGRSFTGAHQRNFSVRRRR